MGAIDEGADQAVRHAAIALVGDAAGVRVEDYLAALAAATGEAVLAAAGFDVAGHGLVPGSALLFEPVNGLLTGDVLEDVPATSVYGMVAPVAPAAMPTPKELYEHTVRSLGTAEWGAVTVTVPDAHWPRVLPLRAAYELRAVVVAVEAQHGIDVTDRHVLAATALRSAVEQVEGAIDLAVAVRLALEVTFGTAKMAPMTDAAFAAASRPSPSP